MTKQSTIKNLLVVPLIASAVLLANPVFAASSTYTSHAEIRHKTSLPHVKKGIVGKVTSINGTIIVVTGKDNVEYTVDASNATIMKAREEPNVNPAIVTISDIQVGDAIVVRGVITDTEISAQKIFEGKMPVKHLKHLKHKRYLKHF